VEDQAVCLCLTDEDLALPPFLLPSIPPSLPHPQVPAREHPVWGKYFTMLKIGMQLPVRGREGGGEGGREGGAYRGAGAARYEETMEMERDKKEADGMHALFSHPSSLPPSLPPCRRLPCTRLGTRTWTPGSWRSIPTPIWCP